MPRHLLFAVSLLLVASGCRGREERSHKNPSPPPRAATDRLLALAAPPGAGTIADLLRERQSWAKAHPARVDGWVLAGRAWVRLARGRGDAALYANAEASARVALALEPGSAAARALLGLVLVSRHEFTAAEKLARRVVAQRPRSLMAMAVLADALVERGRYAEATGVVRRMLATKPGLPGYSRAAYLSWLRGDVRRAKALMRMAFDAGRGARDREPAAWVLVRTADIFFHEGDLAGAAEGYAMARRYLPGYGPAIAGAARVALARGRPAEAARLAERALAARPLAATAWLLADARRAAGDGAGAARAEATVRKLGRTDRRTLARFLAARRREPERAVALAEAEVADRPGIYSQDALAWALHRAGRHGEARAAATRATRLGTRDARLLFHAGAIALASGDDGRGRVLLRRALALNPSFDPTEAAEARALLARLDGAPSGAAEKRP